MFPVSGWAEPNQSNQKKVQGKLDDRQILIYWNELEKAKKGIGIEISRSGIQTQDQAAEESFKKKYQLTDEDIEEIKQKGGNQDFRNRVIEAEYHQLVKKKVEKTKKANLSPEEIEEIKKQLKKNLGITDGDWEDFQEYREEKKEQEKEKLREQMGCSYVDLICDFDIYYKEKVSEIIYEVTLIFVEFVKIDDTDFYGETKNWYDLPGNSIYKYQQKVQELAWAFLGLFLAYQSIRILALYTVEPNPLEMKKLLLRLVTTSILIAIEPYLVKFLLTLNRYLISDLMGMGEKHIADTLLHAFGMTTGIAISALFPHATALAVTLLGIIAILLLIILLQVVLRFAEIAILAVVGPFVIATNMNEQFNLFPAWWKQLLSAIFTVSVQLFLIILMCAFLKNEIVNNLFGETAQFTKYLIVIGFSLVIIRSPGLLREWMHSTGATRMGVSTVTSFVKTAIRFVKP